MVLSCFYCTHLLCCMGNTCYGVIQCWIPHRKKHKQQKQQQHQQLEQWKSILHKETQISIKYIEKNMTLNGIITSFSVVCVVVMVVAVTWLYLCVSKQRSDKDDASTTTIMPFVGKRWIHFRAEYTDRSSCRVPFGMGNFIYFFPSSLLLVTKYIYWIIIESFVIIIKQYNVC